MKRFFIVDVFTSRPFSGNPLAVVCEAGDLSGRQMQAIARELNLSETIFFTGRGSGRVEARIFTPAAELSMAGHPVLGGAWVALRRLGVVPDRRGRLEMVLPGGNAVIRFEGRHPADTVWMEFPQVVLGDPCDPQKAAEIVGLEGDAVAVEGGTRMARAGVDYVLVPLRDPAALARCQVVPQAYATWIAEGGPRGIYVSAPRGNQRFDARMFAPALGIAEDPATGSAAACLAAWLQERERRADRETIEAEIFQGDAIGRPSRIRLRTQQTPTGVRVEIGGAVCPVACGEIEAP